MYKILVLLLQGQAYFVCTSTEVGLWKGSKSELVRYVSHQDLKTKQPQTRWLHTGFYKSFKEQCQAFSNYLEQLKMKEYSLAPFMRPLLCCYQNQFLIILENPKYNTRKPNLTTHWKDYIPSLSGMYPWNARTIHQTVSDKYSLLC